MDADARIICFLAAGRYAQELTPVDAPRRKPGDYHVSLGYLGLDVEVSEGEGSTKFGYGALVPLPARLLTRQQAAVDEVWSQDFIHGGHVALIPDLLEELADHGLVVLLGPRHGSLLS